MSRFEIGASDFLLDGAPHRILSGALHLFRVHPGQWADRIRKAKQMGLNTIETYVAWNAHEPVRGRWDETGGNDLGAFLDLVAAEGMHAIVRPGPYICAEWTNGGLPAWLTAIDGIGLRRSEPQYLAEVTRYLERVYAIVAPRQIDEGGPVILVQIENEYGAYGDDKAYLEHLVRVTRGAGITVPLTTIDQPEPGMLRAGSLPGLHMTGSFGSRATERLATLRAHQPTGPLMCAEFWDGWFDWWGGVHHTTTADASAAELDTLLAAGASVNFYMFHGGTNFGLTSGANHKGRYLPITTSYDYSAPLDERGDPTEKYWAFREVIARYAPVPAETPSASPPAPSFEVTLTDVGDLIGALDAADAVHEQPPTFEQLGFTGGLVRYDADLPEGAAGGTRRLEVGEVRDRAWVHVDGAPVGSLSRTHGERSLPIPSGARLTILVEERGRVNYGPRIGEPKGLIAPVRVDGIDVVGWRVRPVTLEELDDAAAAAATRVPSAQPAGAGRMCLVGDFELAAPVDLFLDTSGWGSGMAVMNGFVLGRYDRTGPQRTLFVPAASLRPGRNRLVVVELADAVQPLARFTPSPDLGWTDE